MSDLDRMIKDSLDEMDRDRPELSVEPGYFKQALGLFTGRLAWVHWVIMITQSVFFIAGVVCAVQFFQAETVLDALRWGLPGAVSLIYAAIFKASLGPQMETNRLLTELKRMELRVERLRAEQR